MTFVQKKNVIIGAGPSGLQSAIKLAESGVSTDEIIVVDKSKPGRVENETAFADQSLKLGIHTEYQWYVLKLVTEKNRVQGVIVVDKTTGEVVTIKANVVVLATGSYSAIYSKSKSDGTQNYCGGIQLALEAGARVGDLEMISFTETENSNPDILTEAGDSENGSEQSIVISLGGIHVDPVTSMSDVEGLFAVGMSVVNDNPTAEIIKNGSSSYAQGLSETSVRIIHTIPQTILSDEEFSDACTRELSGIRTIPDLGQIRSLQTRLGLVMWKTSGMVRSEDRLLEGAHLLGVIADGVERIAIEAYSDRVNIYQLCETRELIGSIITSTLIIKSALERKESRNGHHREDYPEQSIEWNKHILYRKSGGGILDIAQEIIPEKI